MPPKTTKTSKTETTEAKEDNILNDELEKSPKAPDITVILETDADKQLAHLAEVLEMPDYLTNQKQSIVLDYYLHGLQFCKSCGFEKDQIAALMGFLWKILELFQQGPQTRVEDVKSLINEQLVEFASFPEVVEPEVVPEVVEKGKKKQTNAVVDEKPPVERKPMFQMDDVSLILHFLMETVIQHYRLYLYVFHEEQNVSKFEYVHFLQTPTEPVPHIDMRTEEELVAIEKQKEEAQRVERERLEKEEEDRIRQVREERLRKEKELEELKTAPKLSKKELDEVAEYLKGEVDGDVEQKACSIMERIDNLTKMVEEAKADPKKKKKKK